MAMLKTTDIYHKINTIPLRAMQMDQFPTLTILQTAFMRPSHC